MVSVDANVLTEVGQFVFLVQDVTCLFDFNNNILIGVVLGLLDCQVDGFRGDESVGENLLDGWKSDSFAVIAVDDCDREGICEETLIHDVSCLGSELNKVIEVIGSVQDRKELCGLLEVLLVEAGEQSSPGEVSITGKPWISLLNGQLLPGQGSEFLEQGQNTVSLLFDSHLRSLWNKLSSIEDLFSW